MFEYKPERSNEVLSYDDIGSVSSEFEGFKPDPKYSWEKGKRFTTRSRDDWKTVVPKTAPPIKRLPEVIERMVNSTWKFAEPSAGAQRGSIVMGTRGAPSNSLQSQPYHPQVNPFKINNAEITKTAIASDHPQVNPIKINNAEITKTAIASDWNLFKQIERTNAVTFRGDSRSPSVIINQFGGFTPPNTRTDRSYLENQIFDHFKDYLQRRYQRPLTKEAFLRAVDTAVSTAEDKKLLVDYMMWRKITEGESMHLGRMVIQECLKGYISTARAIDTSITFATRFNADAGWVYITMVHGGFIVPFGKDRANWQTEEAEIAHWGAIPSARIVGFARFNRLGRLDSHIYVRRSFRKSEPKAFETMFKIMSGKTPVSG